jgi:hypothetical protein
MSKKNLRRLEVDMSRALTAAAKAAGIFPTKKKQHSGQYSKPRLVNSFGPPTLPNPRKVKSISGQTELF